MKVSLKKILEIKNTFINEEKYKCITFCNKKIYIKKQISIVEKLRDIKSRYLFSKYTIRKNSVLLVEPNAYHGEILPGFVKYFQDLGFNVDLILRYKNYDDSPFLDFKNLNIIPSSSVNMRTLLKNKKIKKYEHCLLTSSALWDNNFYFGSFLKFLGFTPNIKKEVMLVEHNIMPCIEEFNEEYYLKNNKLFTLSGMSNTLMLNPHYFTEKINFTKNFITIFITSGHDIKGLDLIFETTKKLLETNYSNFKIFIIGKKIRIPQQFNTNISSLGYVSFKKMYDLLYKSDFILPMLDPNNDKHKKYLNQTTFGARQQCLGFLKPMLINEVFAKVYDFDDTNAIAYKENDLYEAMKQAIEMTQEDYSKKQMFLKNLANEVYNQSLNNLRKAIEE